MSDQSNAVEFTNETSNGDRSNGNGNGNGDRSNGNGDRSNDSDDSPSPLLERRTDNDTDTDTDDSLPPLLERRTLNSGSDDDDSSSSDGSLPPLVHRVRNLDGDDDSSSDEESNDGEGTETPRFGPSASSRGGRPMVTEAEFSQVMLEMVREFAETVFHESNEEQPPPKSVVKCPVCNFAHEEVEVVFISDDEDDDDYRYRRTCNFHPQLQHAASHGCRTMFIQTECPVCFEKCGPPVVALPCGHCVCKDDFERLGGRTGKAANEIPEPPPRAVRPSFPPIATYRDADVDMGTIETYARLLNMSIRDGHFPEDTDDDDDDDDDDRSVYSIFTTVSSGDESSDDEDEVLQEEEEGEEEEATRPHMRVMLEEATGPHINVMLRNQEPAGRPPRRNSASPASEEGTPIVIHPDSDDNIDGGGDTEFLPPWLRHDDDDNDDTSGDSGPPDLIERSSAGNSTLPLIVRSHGNNESDDDSSIDNYHLPPLIQQTYRHNSIAPNSTRNTTQNIDSDDEDGGRDRGRVVVSDTLDELWTRYIPTRREAQEVEPSSSSSGSSSVDTDTYYSQIFQSALIHMENRHRGNAYSSSSDDEDY